MTTSPPELITPATLAITSLVKYDTARAALTVPSSYTPALAFTFMSFAESALTVTVPPARIEAPAAISVLEITDAYPTATVVL